MNIDGERLDIILSLLLDGDVTPLQLLSVCKDNYGMDTDVFVRLVKSLEDVGLIRKRDINTTCVVYHLCK